MRYLLAAGVASTLLSLPFQKASAEPALSLAREEIVTRSHSTSLVGRNLQWDSHAGRLAITGEGGKETALIFYTAYTVAPSRGHSRPVTFMFNGGPGASSMWIHTASFAPLRVDLGKGHGETLVPNTDTLLDQTDLVVIDAPGTGYSRIADGIDPKTFDSVDSDANVFSQFVMRFLSQERRWGSSRYLIGESYGAPRVAIMLSHLASQGINFNGAVFISPILNFGLYTPGTDQGSINTLPSLAAVSWAHDGVDARGSETVEARIERAQRFAEGPYLEALIRGDTLPLAARQEIASKLHDLTGIETDYFLRHELRIQTDAFLTKRLASSHQVLSRTDGRIAAEGAITDATQPDFDPQDREINGPILNGMHTLLATELGYTSTLPYVPMIPGLDYAWDWRHMPSDGEPQTSADTIPDLTAALRDMPHLKIIVMCGRFDLETPFAGTLYDLAHTGLPPNLKAKISTHFYNGGHLTYLDPTARHEMRADLKAFYAAGEAP